MRLVLIASMVVLVLIPPALLDDYDDTTNEFEDIDFEDSPGIWDGVQQVIVDISKPSWHWKQANSIVNSTIGIVMDMHEDQTLEIIFQLILFVLILISANIPESQVYILWQEFSPSVWSFVALVTRRGFPLEGFKKVVSNFFNFAGIGDADETPPSIKVLKG